LYERLKELDTGKPFRIFRIRRFPDGTLFYEKLASGQNIPKLYVRTADGRERLLVDPEAIESADRQHFSINSYSPSADGRFVVYGLAKGGSEQTVLHIKNVNTGKDLAETIDHIETAYNVPQWLPDGSGFFYCRRRDLPADAPQTEIYKKTKVYFHKLNTDVKNDRLIMGIGLSERVPLEAIDFPSLHISSGSDYAVAKIKHGDATEISLYSAPVKSLLGENIPWKKVCGFDDEVSGYAVHGDTIYLRTAKDAPRFKVVSTSLDDPDFAHAKTVIRMSDKVVDRLTVAKDGLYAEIIDGGFNRILRLVFEKGAKAGLLNLPKDEVGYIESACPQIDGILVYATSWTKGGLIYRYDPASNSFTDSGLMPRGKYDDVAGFTSREVKVKSYDGTMVPLSIIYKEGIKLDGSNPTLLMGYGSYGISIGVNFSPLNIAWMERGGVLAVAHVRGGGEYGKAWHLAGQKLNKPNTWKDFIACAEYLIKEGYTSRKRIAGQGGSAGGILIGRAITECPDLFAAALINVGALDAIRFETTTNGVPNIPEFGSVKTEDGFKGLYEMSAYHHVKDGVRYPAVLLTHGINDPRVKPWMSAKMTARLQAASASGKPVLLRVEYDAGHGIGSTRDQHLGEKADEWSFLLWQFGLLK
jgi:prolyl oligopeptidase